MRLVAENHSSLSAQVVFEPLGAGPFECQIQDQGFVQTYLDAGDDGVDHEVPQGAVRRAARCVNRIGPVGQPHGGAHTGNLHNDEPQHEHTEAQLASHCIDVGAQHLE